MAPSSKAKAKGVSASSFLDLKAELAKQLQKARKQEKAIGATGEESLFQEYVRVTHTEGVGDQEATKMVLELFDDADIRAPLATITNQATGAKGKGKGKGLGKPLPSSKGLGKIILPPGSLVYDEGIEDEALVSGNLVAHAEGEDE